MEWDCCHAGLPMSNSREGFRERRDELEEARRERLRHFGEVREGVPLHDLRSIAPALHAHRTRITQASSPFLEAHIWRPISRSPYLEAHAWKPVTGPPSRNPNPGTSFLEALSWDSLLGNPRYWNLLPDNHSWKISPFLEPHSWIPLPGPRISSPGTYDAAEQDGNDPRHRQAFRDQVPAEQPWHGRASPQQSNEHNPMSQPRGPLSSSDCSHSIPEAVG